jgi:hypothetical protein
MTTLRFIGAPFSGFPAFRQEMRAQLASGPENFVQRPRIENVVGPSFKLRRRGMAQTFADGGVERPEAAGELAGQHGEFALLPALLHALYQPLLPAFGKEALAQSLCQSGHFLILLRVAFGVKLFFIVVEGAVYVDEVDVFEAFFDAWLECVFR